MLLWTTRARGTALAVFALVVTVVFVAPIATVIAAALAGAWTGPLPSDLGGEHLGAALSDENLASLSVSLQTAFIAGGIALFVGTWAALAAREAPAWLRKTTDAVFHLPIAVPSVAIGLGLLIAFNSKPLLLGGTKWIVILAHTVLVTAFAHQSVSAAIRRLDPMYEQAAASLGARPSYVLLRVRLPLLLPSLNAAAGLCFALSMGELSATMMLYPPDWLPLPVLIFTATDRGSLFTGSALAVVLMAATLLVLLAVSRVRTKASYR